MIGGESAEGRPRVLTEEGPDALPPRRASAQSGESAGAQVAAERAASDLEPRAERAPVATRWARKGTGLIHGGEQSCPPSGRTTNPRSAASARSGNRRT